MRHSNSRQVARVHRIRSSYSSRLGPLFGAVYTFGNDKLPRYRDAAKDGELLSEQVFIGFVKRRFSDYVTIEFRTPVGIFDQDYGFEDFEEQQLPPVGKTVRFISHLLTAPDMETVDSDEPAEVGDVPELTSTPGQRGHYSLDE